MLAFLNLINDNTTLKIHNVYVDVDIFISFIILWLFLKIKLALILLPLFFQGFFVTNHPFVYFIIIQ